MGFRSTSDDVASAIRAIGRHPRNPLIAALMLAVALGSVVGIFDVVRRVEYAPLPYRQASTLVVADARLGPFLVSVYDGRANPHAGAIFEHLAECHLETAELATSSPPRRVLVAYVTPGFFSVLGVRMTLGTGLPDLAPPRPDRPIGWLPIVIGHRLWQDRFASDPNIIGREVQLKFIYPARYLVVGVAPPGVGFPSGADAWVPEHLDSTPPVQTAGPPNWTYLVVARLRPGVSLPKAEAAIASWPRGDFHWGWDGSARLFGLRAFLEGELYHLAPFLWLVTVLLLCAALGAVVSVWRLELQQRRTEFWIKGILGCAPGRLLRLRIAELAAILALALAGGALVRAAVLRLTARALHLDWALGLRLTGADLVLSLGALAVVAGLTVLPEALSFGLLPLLGRPTVGGVRRTALGHARGATGAAIATTILILAAVLLTTAFRISRLDTGLRPAGVFVCEMVLPFDRDHYVYGGLDPKLPIEVRTREAHAKRKEFDRLMDFYFARILARIKAGPDVQSAGVISAAPYNGDPPSTWEVYVARTPPYGPPFTGGISAQVVSIGGGALASLGIDVVLGRALLPNEANGVLINRAMARRIGSGPRSLGQFITVLSLMPPVRIVGVVNDVRQQDIFAPPVPTIYFPLGRYGPTDADIVFRAPANMTSHQALTLARSAAQNAAPGTIVSRFEPLEEMIDSGSALTGYLAEFLAALAAVAVFLVGLSAWAECSAQARRREHEMGIRLAIGCRPTQLVRLMVSRHAAGALAGICLGTIAAWLLARFIGSLLHGFEPRTAIFLVCAGLVEAYTVAVSSWAIGRQARSSPMDLISKEPI